eukprot:TRINITY_DN1097_c0_g1_i2.p1 TRINITY_DN1097_c0_g1~~TRINITY_DN1097_c0_g1_i2.p1  ORF type:complete len:131 (-),score=33.73 TRINITY_DN1097_c0_g1_i2:276-668(-)
MADDYQPIEKVYENTYLTKPKEGTKFHQTRVTLLLRELLDARLRSEKRYDPARHSAMSKDLSNEIQAKVKEMGFQRYKIITYVFIGENRGQGIRFGSRCLWDTDTDNCASEFYQNQAIFCSATVFGLYYE